MRTRSARERRDPVRLLLDTHALLWWLTDDPKLPAHVGSRIDDPTNDIAISPVSAYELRFNALKGLLPGGDLAAAEIAQVADVASFTILPLTLDHAILAGGLPLPHRDPFDRFLAAQALLGDDTILSVDAAFDGPGVPRVW